MDVEQGGLVGAAARPGGLAVGVAGWCPGGGAQGGCGGGGGGGGGGCAQMEGVPWWLRSVVIKRSGRGQADLLGGAGVPKWVAGPKIAWDFGGLGGGLAKQGSQNREDRETKRWRGGSENSQKVWAGMPCVCDRRCGCRCRRRSRRMRSLLEAGNMKTSLCLPPWMHAQVK